MSGENRILDAEEVERIRYLDANEVACEDEIIRLTASHEALRAALATAEAENALLRSPHDAYTEDGEPLLPRGWVPIDGGRYDELEAAEARVGALEAALRDTERALAWALQRDDSPQPRGVEL